MSKAEHDLVQTTGQHNFSNHTISMSISHLIFGKVRSYGIEFGCWHWRWRLVEKIVCSVYWQQSLWASRRAISFTETRLFPAGCVFATLNHYQTKRKQWRVFLNLKLLILIELVKYFPYWSDSSQHWQQSHFYIIDKGAYHNKATRISKCYKKGSWFGLTKALLAEGDAFSPPLPHIAALLLRKVMRAQRQRELQEKTTSWTINTSQLSHFMSIAIMSIVFLIFFKTKQKQKTKHDNYMSGLTGVFDHGVFSQHTLVLQRLRLQRLGN